MAFLSAAITILQLGLWYVVIEQFLRGIDNMPWSTSNVNLLLAALAGAAVFALSRFRKHARSVGLKGLRETAEKCGTRVGFLTQRIGTTRAIAAIAVLVLLPSLFLVQRVHRADRGIRIAAFERICAARCLGDAIRDVREDKSPEFAERVAKTLVSDMRYEADQAPHPRAFGRGAVRRAIREVRSLAVVLSDVRSPGGAVVDAFSSLDRAALDIEAAVEGATGVRSRAEERVKLLVEKALETSMLRQRLEYPNGFGNYEVTAENELLMQTTIDDLDRKYEAFLAAKSQRSP